MLVGHKKSAKTAAIVAFQNRPSDEEVTINSAFVCYTVQVCDKNVLLNLCNTAGQEQFPSLDGIYLRGAHVVLLCFCTYAPETIQALKELWLQTVRMVAPDALAILVAIRATSHMAQEDVAEMEARGYGIMTDSEIEALAQELGVSTWWSIEEETRAGATDLLSFIAESCLSRYGIIPLASSKDKKGCSVA